LTTTTPGFSKRYRSRDFVVGMLAALLCIASLILIVVFWLIPLSQNARAMAVRDVLGPSVSESSQELVESARLCAAAETDAEKAGQRVTRS
jgi:hypothetical protein